MEHKNRLVRVKITERKMENLLNLKAGSAIYRMSYDFDTRTIQLMISHRDFTLVTEGAVIPLVGLETIEEEVTMGWVGELEERVERLELAAGLS